MLKLSEADGKRLCVSNKLPFGAGGRQDKQKWRKKMHKHTKRWTAFAMAMALILTLLTGCGAQPAPSVAGSSAAPSSGGDATVGGEQTVRMWTFLDPEADNGRSKALKQMIETFEAENPGIKIVLETQDWEQMTP